MEIKSIPVKGDSLGRSVAFVKEKSDDNNDNKGFTAVANTDIVDRDSEVVLPKGCAYDLYLKNPVMLNIHNYNSPSVGKVTDIRVGDKIEFDFEFAQTPEGKQFEYLYLNGFQKAFSIGFIPKEYVRVQEETPDVFEVNVFGSLYKIDLSKYNKRPRAIITHWELLEISPVPVPSNPEALLLSAKEKLLSQYDNGALKQIISVSIDDELQSLKESFKNFVEGRSITRGTVPFRSYPVNMETAWDQANARVQLAKWASSDGSGAKEKIDWGKYAKGFAWFDESKPDALGSYKLPHHYVQDDSLITVWKGVTSAMRVLLGGQGGVDVGNDLEAVYNHLAKHYKDAEKDPPPLKEYSDDELKAIEDGTWTPDYGKKEDDKKEDDTKDEKEDAILEKVENIVTDLITEVENSLTVQLTILGEKLQEVLDKMTVQGGDDYCSDDVGDIVKGFLEDLKSFNSNK